MWREVTFASARRWAAEERWTRTLPKALNGAHGTLRSPNLKPLAALRMSSC